MVNRPGVVWMFFILGVLGILNSVYESIITLSSGPQLTTLTLIGYIITIILLIPTAIFLYFFIMLNKKSITWLYVSFGVLVLANIITAQWVFAIITAILAWVVWDYIKNKKVDEQPVFN